MASSDSTSEIKKLHTQVKNLLEQNYSKEVIIKQLQEQGVAPYYIESIIENVKNEKTDSKSFRNCLIMGIFYIVAGLLVNIFSYRIAENTNSSFFYLFWGIVVFGIVTIIRGFILYKR
jgi:hypothetical protein